MLCHKRSEPQAPGRSERLNRTLQDRLVREPRLHGATTLAAANAYLRERFLPDYNETFSRPPADPASAFVPLGAVALDQILCQEEDRTTSRSRRRGGSRRVTSGRARRRRGG